MIVGLIGQKQSGKTTSTEYLVKELGFTEIAFADILKESLATLTGESITNYHDNDLKEKETNALGVTRRSAMQKFGDAVKNAFGDEIFINLTRKKVHTLLRADKSIVFSDVRFFKEASFIRHIQDSVLIRIERPKGSDKSYTMIKNDFDEDDTSNVQHQTSKDVHESEMQQLQIIADMKIVNGGTIADLKQALRICIQKK